MTQDHKFEFGNINLISKEECRLLQETKKKKIAMNEDYEFCIGKKNKLPNLPLIYSKVYKPNKTLEEEQKLAKKCKEVCY